MLVQEITKRDEEKNESELLTDIDLLEQELARKKQLVAQKESSSSLFISSSFSSSRIYLDDESDESESMSGFNTFYVQKEI